MNKNDILKNALILPLAIGIVLAVLFCFYLNSNVDRLLPVAKNTAFAYHDVVEDGGEVDANALNDNDVVGAFEVDGTKLNIRYNSNYSNLVSSLSFDDSSNTIGEIGCVYLKTTKANAELISKSDKAKISSVYGDFSYKLCDKRVFNNEYSAKRYAPRLSSSLVIYYQASDGAGLSSKYNALVYEEVE